MELELLADLPRGVGEIAAALQEQRRRQHARREHDGLRLDAEARPVRAAERRDDASRDARHAAPVREQLLGAHRGEHARAELDRGGHVRDVHRLLGARAATREAFAAAATLL